MTSSRVRAEYTSCIAAALWRRAWWRIIDISGTTPEPPPTSSTGAASAPSHTNHPPIGPRDFELVAHLGDRRQVRRDLASVDSDHGQLERVGAWGRGDRVTPLRLVAVVGGEADVDVLSGQMTGPARNVEAQGRGAGGLWDGLGDGRDQPLHDDQSPQ